MPRHTTTATNETTRILYTFPATVLCISSPHFADSAATFLSRLVLSSVPPSRDSVQEEQVTGTRGITREGRTSVYQNPVWDDDASRHVNKVADGLLEGAHSRVADVAEALQKTASVDRAHVSRFRLGVVFCSAFAPGYRSFEYRRDLFHSLRRQRNNEHRPGERVVLVTRDDDRWTLLLDLLPARRVEVDQPDVTLAWGFHRHCSRPVPSTAPGLTLTPSCSSPVSVRRHHTVADGRRVPAAPL